MTITHIPPGEAVTDEASAAARLEVLEVLRGMETYLAVRTGLPVLYAHVTISQPVAPGSPRGLRLELLQQYADAMGTEVVPDSGSMTARKRFETRGTLVYYVEPEDVTYTHCESDDAVDVLAVRWGLRRGTWIAEEGEYQAVRRVDGRIAEVAFCPVGSAA
jgi:hypothetical protein